MFSNLKYLNRCIKNGHIVNIAIEKGRYYYDLIVFCNIDELEHSTEVLGNFTGSDDSCAITDNFYNTDSNPIVMAAFKDNLLDSLNELDNKAYRFFFEGGINVKKRLDDWRELMIDVRDEYTAAMKDHDVNRNISPELKKKLNHFYKHHELLKD